MIQDSWNVTQAEFSTSIYPQKFCNIFCIFPNFQYYMIVIKADFLHCLFSSYIQFIKAPKLKKDSSLYIGTTFSIVVSHYRTISASQASQILRLFLLLDFTSSFVYSARILGNLTHFTFLLSPTHTNYCIPNRLLGLLRCLNHYMRIALQTRRFIQLRYIL